MVRPVCMRAAKGLPTARPPRSIPSNVVLRGERRRQRLGRRAKSLPNGSPIVLLVEGPRRRICACRHGTGAHLVEIPDFRRADSMPCGKDAKQVAAQGLNHRGPLHVDAVGEEHVRCYGVGRRWAPFGCNRWNAPAPPDPPAASLPNRPLVHAAHVSACVRVPPSLPPLARRPPVLRFCGRRAMHDEALAFPTNNQPQSGFSMRRNTLRNRKTLRTFSTERPSYVLTMRTEPGKPAAICSGLLPNMALRQKG